MGNWIGKTKLNDFHSRGGDKASIFEDQHCGNQQEAMRYEKPTKSNKSTPPCIQFANKEDILSSTSTTEPAPDPRSPTAGIIRTPARAETDDLQKITPVQVLRQLTDSAFSFDSVQNRKVNPTSNHQLDGKEAYIKEIASFQDDSPSKDKEKTTTNMNRFRRSLRKFSSSMSRRHRFQYSSFRNARDNSHSDQIILTSDDDDNPRGIGFRD